MTRRHILVSSVLVLLAPLVRLHGQKGSAVEQQLIAADRSYFEALAGPHPDMDRLQRLLGPEYTHVDQDGSEPRADVLKEVEHLSNLSFQYDKPQAVALSPTAGYVIADVHYSWPFNGSFDKEHKRTTTVFALRDGRWIATLHTELSIFDDREEILAHPEDSNADLIAMRRLRTDVISEVRIPGYAPFPFYPVSFDAATAISFSDGHGAHEADFRTLPPPMQQVWNQWASYTKDEPSGEALFKDMFYRFFFVHELGHLISGRVVDGLPAAESKQVAANMRANAIEKELMPNRIAVAWFREHDPRYLARLVSDFRVIEAHLPNPVPQGSDPKRYFTQNYLKLSADPVAYGWYQLYMVITVYDEPPKSFQQILDTLPKVQYNQN